MPRVGFELEIITKLDEYEIIDDLYAILGKRFQVVPDCTIRRDKNTQVKDGWQGWEIITRPYELECAIEIMKGIQEYLDDIEAVTNNSTGFHVNISSQSMSKFDPLTLICVTDEYKLAKDFGRENNGYCNPWQEYFDKMKRSIRRDAKRGIIKQEQNWLKKNADYLVDMIATNTTYDKPSDNYRYACRMLDTINPKYMSINVAKLNELYVEFRMLGGKDYHRKNLELYVRKLAENVEFAAKGRDTECVNEYFNQYWE